MSSRPLLDRIELLVENELSASDKVLLFEELDGQPALWKTLALSFSEQQTLERNVKELHLLANNCSVPAMRPPVQPQSSHRMRSRENLWLIVPAAILVSLVSGWWLGHSDGPSARTAQVAREGQQLNEAAGEIAVSQPPSEPATETRHLSAPVVGYARWHSKLGPKLAPVLHATESGADWLESNPPSIDAPVQRQLSQAGVQAVPKRNLITVSLSGKWYTIPMDDLRLVQASSEVL